MIDSKTFPKEPSSDRAYAISGCNVGTEDANNECRQKTERRNGASMGEIMQNGTSINVCEVVYAGLAVL